MAARVETTIGRYKAIIGRNSALAVCSRSRAKLAMAVEVLNRMVWIAKPTSVRMA